MKDQKLAAFSLRTMQKNAVAFQGQNRARLTRENLGILKRRASDSGEVTKDEPIRYQFELKRQKNVRVTLENKENLGLFDLFGTKKRVQAKLLDSTRSSVLESTDRLRPGADQDFKLSLKPGTYYIQVTGRSENEVEYELNLKTGDFSDD